MKQVPFLVILSVFCLGITASNVLHLNYLTSSVLLLFCLLCYFLISNEKFELTKRNLLSTILIASVFFLGSTRYSVSLSENYSYSLINNYLKGDLILGKINSIAKNKNNYAKAEFEALKIIRFQDTIPVQGKIILFVKQENEMPKEFDVCLISSSLNKIKNKNNPGEFDAELFWKHKEIDFISFTSADEYQKIGFAKPNLFSKFTDLRNYFSSILEKKLSGDELAIAKALILGDKSNLDNEITSKFGNTGAMHVLAVSGLHVGILVQLLTLFLGLFKKWISKNKTIVIALIVIWIYACMTGLSASVVRSVLMFSILVGSNLLHKNYNNFNVLAFSAFLILMWNPHFLFDIGFQLSYLAMLGIFMFYTPLSKAIHIKNKVLKTVYEGTMVGVAAQLMTIPLTLYYFHQFPNYFILTNIGLMLFSFLILAFGIALFSFSWLPLINNLLAFLLSISIFSMLFIIDFIDNLPGAVSIGFVLNGFLVFSLFCSIILFFFSLKFANIKWLKISLLLAILITSGIVTIRFNQINSNKIYFLNSDDAQFIVKSADKNFVFYANKNGDLKKASYLANSFQKIHPGELHFIEISNKKETLLKSEKLIVNIVRQRGGYEIDVNSKKYFYVSSFYNTSELKRKIISPKLEISDAKYQLKKGALAFEL